MVPLSFKMPEHIAKQLQKQPGYTTWVASLVLKHMGFCVLCGQKKQKTTKVKKDE